MNNEELKMSKSKKGIVALLTCMLMVSAITASVFADENAPIDENRPNSVTISEKDIVKSLQAKTDAELESMDYSPEEIASLRKLTDEAVVAKARSQSDAELKDRGLTEKQIDIIRNENDVQLAAAESFGSVTYTVDYVTYEYKKPNTTLKVMVTWKWSSAPLFLFTDIIACTTNKEDFTKVKASGTADYSFSRGGTILSSSPLSVKTESSGRGTYAKIDLSKTYTGAARPTKMIAFEGSMFTTFKAPKKITAVGMSSKYGHATMTLSPGVSFGANGTSISFTPVSKVETGDEAYRRATL